MGREPVTSSVADECFSNSATVNLTSSAIEMDIASSWQLEELPTLDNQTIRQSGTMLLAAL